MGGDQGVRWFVGGVGWGVRWLVGVGGVGGGVRVGGWVGDGVDGGMGIGGGGVSVCLKMYLANE